MEGKCFEPYPTFSVHFAQLYFIWSILKQNMDMQVAKMHVVCLHYFTPGVSVTFNKEFLPVLYSTTSRVLF